MLGTWEERVVIARKALWMLGKLSVGHDRSMAMRRAEVAFQDVGLLPAIVDRSGPFEFVSDLIAENLLFPDWLREKEISAESVRDIETFDDLIDRLTPRLGPPADGPHRPRKPPHCDLVVPLRFYVGSQSVPSRRSPCSTPMITDALDSLPYGEAVARIVTEIAGAASGGLALKKIKLPDGRDAILKMEISTLPEDLKWY
jgi:hypothetical protein